LVTQEWATNCNSDTLQVVSFFFGLNYPEFPDSCFWLDFCGLKDVFQVLADGAHIHGEQLGHQLLAEQDRLTLIARRFADG
jgi:hypothetical protein